MEWISSLQFESFRAWFFVFRTDDYRVFASICVLGVASLLLFYLAPNDALLNGCNTCLRKMGRQLLSSGNGGHNAEKAARLFVAWSGRNGCRIGIALCYPGGK